MVTEASMKLASLLKSWRRASGLSMKEWARSVDVSREYVRLIELGRRVPSYEVVEKMAALVGISGRLDNMTKLLDTARVAKRQDVIAVVHRVLKRHLPADQAAAIIKEVRSALPAS